MNITKSIIEDKTILKIDGWLDTASSPLLGEEIEKIESATKIVLDFENVEYIASSGLRQVIACHKKAKDLGSEFSIINLNRETFSIFTMTGLDKKLNISKK